MIESGQCEFSPCRQYRYVLIRELQQEPPGLDSCIPGENIHGPYCECKPLGSFLLVIGLNPSTADETKNDPTIRRCISFARDWGFRQLVMMNIFAFRATEPRDMMLAANPVGPTNDLRLIAIASHCQARGGIVLAAWGAHGGHADRDRKVNALMEFEGVRMHCLGITQRGFPKHPLYVKGDTLPVPYTP